MIAIVQLLFIPLHIMQKDTVDLGTTETNLANMRQQEFSFVGPGSKNQIPFISFGRNPQPPRLPSTSPQRSFELTFQQNSSPSVEMIFLKRQEKKPLENHYQIQQGEETQSLGRFQSKDQVYQHEHQQVKQQRSSSSESQRKKKNENEDEKSLVVTVNIDSNMTERISELIKKSDSQDFIELNFQLPDVYESQILLNKNIEDYGPNRANVCGTESVHFCKFKISIDGILKVKIYPTIVKKKSFRIKITHESEIYNMGVELKRELYYLPEHYIWFAKLINSKLIRMGCIVGKGSGNGHLHPNGIFNKGVIYKCSKYRKKWEKRFVVISNEGLFSYINPKENYTVHIPTEHMEELWTNFEVISQCLIIKLRHKGGKAEFGIPILDYCLREDSQNWLFSFYRLLMEHKIHIKI